MGYRSQVRCVIYGGPEVLDSFIAKHVMQGNKFLSELGDYIKYGLVSRTTYEPNGVTHKIKLKIMDFFGDGFKWYESFEDVRGLDNMLSDIDNNYEDKLDYEFIRVGEEQNDIETKYSNDSYGYISTSTVIVADMEMEEIPNEKD